MSFMVRHLIRRQVFVRAQDSVRQLCVMRVSDLKLTVHIRTETLWISVYLTVGIWKFPLLLGGEHLVTLAAVRAVAAKYPDLHIIHFDAHADLRDDYLGARLSHACVLRRCHDLLGDGRIHQFCIRSGEREEFRFAAQHTDFHPLSFDGLEETVRELKEKNVPIYFTIDLDCLDPAVFPGTGTPEAGGVTFLELLEAIRTVAQANVVGADVNELAPMLDASGVSTATACKVLRELLLAIAK